MVGYEMSVWLDIKCLDGWIYNRWMVGYKMSGWMDIKFLDVWI